MNYCWMPIVLLPLLAPSCQSLHHEDEDETQEITLDQVPAQVRAAANSAVTGFVLEQACTETEDGVLIYCLEGHADGKEYEIDISASGKVLEIESEDDEDEKDDEDEEAEEEEDD
jgi:uncharacterized membrane protein YkoI